MLKRNSAKFYVKFFKILTGKFLMIRKMLKNIEKVLKKL